MSHVKSYYAATANQDLKYEQLNSNLRTQVCVIGGGFTGLNTAINLAKKGYDVVLIESEKIGWGASGRNGGQLISGFSFSDHFEKKGTENDIQNIWQLGAKSADLVREGFLNSLSIVTLKRGSLMLQQTESTWVN